MTAGDQLDIDRISVRVTGMDPVDAQALARAIAEGLARPLSLAPGEASLERLTVEVRPTEADQTDDVAERAVTGILALLHRAEALEAAG
jgi:hypothetical protein